MFGMLAALATSAAMGTALTAVPATAQPLSGSYVISDIGQGCHALGTLESNGSLTVIGGCAVVPNSAPGGGIQVFTGGTWSGNAAAGVTLCLSFVTITGPQYPNPLCAGPLPVNTGPEVIPDPGGGTGKTFIDITLG
jgi:hypothetical protein